MKREIIINVEQQEKRLAFLEDGLLEEYYFERQKNKRLKGSIMRGKVVRVLSSMEAAFVDIGLEKNGFLHVSDITDERIRDENLLGEELDEVVPSRKSASRKITDFCKLGDEIIVQILKDPISTKGARLTSNIGLPGRYLVLLPMSQRRGVSRRIETIEQRKRLRGIVRSLPIPRPMGAIVRTFGQGETKKAFHRDLKMLLYLWKRIEKRYKESNDHGLIYQEEDVVRRVIRDNIPEEIDTIIVDSKDEYKQIKRLVIPLFDTKKVALRLYRGKEPIFERYHIENQINKIYGSHIWLKSGGYLVIEKTEALVSIDVNSGRNVKGKDAETNILKINLEAADEIARQLRLRNMGGIIVIDFIDMRSKTNQKSVFARLRKALKRDKARFTLLPISDFGLLQMTRQRVEESIGETMLGPCPYCGGTGRIKLVETIAMDIMRRLRWMIAETKTREIKVCANREIINRLEEEFGDQINRLRKKSRTGIELLPIADYHLEKWSCYSAN